MRRFAPLLLTIAIVIAMTALPRMPGGSQDRHQAMGGVPPLSLDGYRNEKLPTGPHEFSGLSGINEDCYVCHGNYRTESLVTNHAKEKVGCVKCHGESLPHQRDEDHRTPPEKMYARDGIDKMCHTCHDTHDAAAAKVIERWQQRCPSRTNPKEIVCTDCHYEHRLPTRQVVWDKKTGKLIIQTKAGQGAKSGKAKSLSQDPGRRTSEPAASDGSGRGPE